MFLALPDEDAGDGRRQLDAAAAAIAVEGQIELDETVRVGRGADDLRQLAGQRGNADGAESGRGRADAGNARVQVEEGMTAPGVAIGARIARHLHRRLEPLLDEVLPELHPLDDQIAAAEFPPRLQQIEAEVDRRPLEVRRRQQLLEAAFGLVAGQGVGQQRQALAVLAELGVREVVGDQSAGFVPELRLHGRRGPRRLAAETLGQQRLAEPVLDLGRFLQGRNVEQIVQGRDPRGAVRRVAGRSTAAPSP